MTKFFILKEYEAQRRERNHPQSFNKSVVGPVYCFHSQGVPQLLPSSCKPHPDLTVYPSQPRARLFFHSPPDPKENSQRQIFLECLMTNHNALLFNRQSLKWTRKAIGKVAFDIWSGMTLLKSQ